MIPRRVRQPLAAFVAASALAAAIPGASPEAAYLQGFSAASGIESPLPHSGATIAAGRATFQQRCAACHGERGRGDGPAAAGLHPPPADLLLHVPQHTEGELYFFIARGIPGTAMPAWRAVLSEEERWQLVHYLHALGEGRP